VERKKVAYVLGRKQGEGRPGIPRRYPRKGRGVPSHGGRKREEVIKEDLKERRGEEGRRFEQGASLGKRDSRDGRSSHQKGGPFYFLERELKGKRGTLWCLGDGTKRGEGKNLGNPFSRKDLLYPTTGGKGGVGGHSKRMEVITFRDAPGGGLGVGEIYILINLKGEPHIEEK